MPSVTARGNYPIPNLSDTANGPTAFSSLAVDLEEHTTMKFATAAARDAVLTVPVAPMMAFLTTPRQLTMYDGTGWVILAEPTQTYTPTLTNMTLGNGTRSGFSKRSDGWCDFAVEFVMGTTSAMGTDPSFSLPYTTGTGAYNSMLVARTFQSAGSVVRAAIAEVTGGSFGTAVTAKVIDTAGATALSLAITATVPHTWTTSSTLHISGRYPMTTRYT